MKMKLSKKQLGLASGVLAACVALTVVWSALGATTSRNARVLTHATVSDSPTPITPSVAQQAVLSRAGIGGSLKLMGTAAGSTYFEIANTSKGMCYGIGRAADALDLITCDPSFPGETPLLDASVVTTTANGDSYLFRAEGWVADDVSSVDAVDESGATVATAKVQNNVFAIDTPELGTNAVGLVARDAAGKTVFTKSYSG